MRPKFLHIMILFILFSFSAKAEYCRDIGNRCVEGPLTKNIDGFDIYKPCWKYEIVRECIKDEYTDYCALIKQTSGCTQISSDCVANGQDGKCLEYSDKYQCGNLLKSSSENTIFLDSEYTITKDALDLKECLPHQYDSNCQEIENVCVEGAETRNINGKDIHKDCWKYEKKYSCFAGSFISDCDEYSKKCTFISEKCLSTDQDQNCRHKEKQYECMNIKGQMPLSMNCNGLEYCIGGDCENVKYEGNKNMGHAISALSILNSMKKDFSEEQCKAGASSCNIFKGSVHDCKINPVSTRNCCRSKGWLNDMKLTDCHENEKMLAKKKEKNLCHYVGSYCSKKLKPLNICLEKKQSYCCFNSKLSRIIQEQGRAQLGIGWGSAENPNCQPLTITQLQSINFDKVDLSEFYADAMSKMNLDKHSQMLDTTKSQISKDSISNLNTKKNTSSFNSNDSSYQEEVARRVREHYDR